MHDANEIMTRVKINASMKTAFLHHNVLRFWYAVESVIGAKANTANAIFRRSMCERLFRHFLVSTSINISKTNNLETHGGLFLIEINN